MKTPWTPHYYRPEFLELLRQNMLISEETWMKLIAADPAGWREFLEGGDEAPTS